MTEPKGRVLVTGVTGFLAGWCVIELLHRGYSVRASLRDMSRAAGVRDALQRLATDADLEAVEFVEADLTSDRGWASAVQDCSDVLHVASPFPATPPRDPDDLILPARDGTARVLTAAAAASVRRVVVTSSTAAIAYGHHPNTVLDETQWTDVTHPLGRRAYPRSKTLAERTAWQMAADLPVELAVICPGTMLGPPTSPRLSYSVSPIELMLTGKMPRLPHLGFPLVDVRDVAALHATALTEPAAAGQRYIAVADFQWLTEVAAVLRTGLGPQASRVSGKTLPTSLARILAIVQPALRQIAAELGREQRFTTAKAHRDLNWKPRPLEDTILDCARGVLGNLTSRRRG